jgi:hypothetical protein
MTKRKAVLRKPSRGANVARHARNIVRQYVPSRDTREIIASAKKLARVVLKSRSLLTKHKRKILSEVQWFISEADGKYTTRYRSKKVVDLARRYLRTVSRGPAKRGTANVQAKARRELIQHEHVNTRKSITDKILRHPTQVVSILNQVIGCVVTKDEHSRLRKAARGWGRYRHAGVRVYDMSFRTPKLKMLRTI